MKTLSIIVIKKLFFFFYLINFSFMLSVQFCIKANLFFLVWLTKKVTYDIILILTKKVTCNIILIITKLGVINNYLTGLSLNPSERHAFESWLLSFCWNNVVQKMRRRVTNPITLYKLTNVLLLPSCFKLTSFFKKYF